MIDVGNFQIRPGDHNIDITLIQCQRTVGCDDLFVVDIGDVNLNRAGCLKYSAQAGVAGVICCNGKRVCRSARHVKIGSVKNSCKCSIDLRNGSQKSQVSCPVSTTADCCAATQGNVNNAVCDLQSCGNLRCCRIHICNGNAADGCLSFLNDGLRPRNCVHRSIVDRRNIDIDVTQRDVSAAAKPNISVVCHRD